eukprot:TRINITY_DN69760_c0_g1_i1.p1 TRINITY_DN69760_c0_g1~~TRINITY_DN69760_c0_g1_i1.p1  ORF type:complete len:292 (+),score=63.04 TRINITY_DN69760_c0_g1_i1:184-1059(+)
MALPSPLARQGGQTMSLSKSNPMLIKAFNLREFSGGRKSLGMERIRSEPTCLLETVKERDRRQRLAELQRCFRQKEEDERGLEKAERKRKLKLREKQQEQARVKRLEAQANLAREQVAQWRKEKEERERIIQEREDEERLIREKHERKRQEEEELLRERKMPILCDVCSGGGGCVSCSGKGIHPAIFLAARVQPSEFSGYTPFEFGQKPRGCEACRGFNQGITGNLQKGNGICVECGGQGKFCSGWCSYCPRRKRIIPVQDESGVCPTCQGRRRPNLASRPTSPTSPTSPS